MNKQPYTYTILRYVHDTTTGEFANVGVVLAPARGGTVEAILQSKIGRFTKMFPGIDGDHFRKVIKHLQGEFDGMKSRMQEELDFRERPATALELAHRVIAPDDSSFQWAPMGSGLAVDLHAQATAIFKSMVERYEDREKAPSRRDEEVWSIFRKELDEKHIGSRFHSKVISVADDEVEFDHAWKNHKWHCLETVSFDLVEPQSIRDKAHSWLGRMTSIQESDEKFQIYYLVGEPLEPHSRQAYEQALNILKKTPVPHEIVPESEAEAFAETMAATISAHDEEIYQQTEFHAGDEKERIHGS